MVRPLPRKLAVLKNFKRPSCQMDVLHLCGVLNYFRTSLRGIKREDGSYKLAAEVLQPLHAIGTEASFPEIWDADAG